MIIDSGANDHVYSSLHLFILYHKIRPINVCLLNGSSVVTNYVGTVTFSSQLYLKNVLYTYDFILNLMLVYNLWYSINYVHYFFDNKFILHDFKSHKMIDLISQNEGL